MPGRTAASFVHLRIDNDHPPFDFRRGSPSVIDPFLKKIEKKFLKKSKSALARSPDSRPADKRWQFTIQQLSGIFSLIIHDLELASF